MPTDTPLDPQRSPSQQDHNETARGEPQFRHEIASDVVLSGRIHFPADARVDGRLKGEVHADQLLLIGPTAEVEARIRAQDLVIEGTLTGDVIESGDVRIASTGSVFGSIQARCLTVDAGARFEGQVRSQATARTELLTVEESAGGKQPSEQEPAARSH
ncbi:MAG: polymer-forming cytoskeletal protein [Candidatus Binatia bacterium]|jgi:cytoskeletal protein CcmA (bactofilin family)|nr:polymer-forming cytoskeletal protein [Candidatus Binatia bacterium]MDG2009561.1 polymer-forming cytoskeletal protein [Candidatus Binatia bacterium]HAC80146.1 hypothetical protein [Deltaproteobacteria bacterium]